MFGIHLRQLYRTCDKVIIRNLRNRRLDTRNPNPGLDKQIKAFESDGLQIKDENIEEFIYKSETDFYNVSIKSSSLDWSFIQSFGFCAEVFGPQFLFSIERLIYILSTSVLKIKWTQINCLSAQWNHANFTGWRSLQWTPKRDTDW